MGNAFQYPGRQGDERRCIRAGDQAAASAFKGKQFRQYQPDVFCRMDLDQWFAQGQVAVEFVGKGIHGQLVGRHEVGGGFHVFTDGGGEYGRFAGYDRQGPLINPVPESRVVIGFYGTAGVKRQPLVDHVQHFVNIPAYFVDDLDLIAFQDQLPQKGRPFLGKRGIVQHPFGILIGKQQKCSRVRLLQRQVKKCDGCLPSALHAVEHPQILTVFLGGLPLGSLPFGQVV